MFLAIAPGSFVQSHTLRFAILGDRTGEAVPGIYQAVWREIAAEKPAFVVGVGDSIQGLDDATAENEWMDRSNICWSRFVQFPFYAAPGNHDVWSEASAKLFGKYTGHPLITVSTKDRCISRYSTTAATMHCSPRRSRFWNRT